MPRRNQSLRAKRFKADMRRLDRAARRAMRSRPRSTESMARELVLRGVASVEILERPWMLDDPHEGEESQ